MHAGVMKTLNIIGAGRVGCTLAGLWRQRRVFEIGSVCNRTRQTAQAAAAFVGAGVATNQLTTMTPAEVWLLATPDGAIAQAAAQLAASGLVRAGDVVFHCSGALASNELRAVTAAGASVGSVHPLKSFADPRDAMNTFAGTYCVAEGDVTALALLVPAFEAIGARIATLDARYKTLYHAASVMVCNYLTALMEAGLQCYEKAGLPRATASAMMEPLVRETVDNVFKLGTVMALTGPIARGDHAVVTHQLHALAAHDARLVDIYRALGVVAAELSRAQGIATPDVLDALVQTLKPGAAEM